MAVRRCSGGSKGHNWKRLQQQEQQWQGRRQLRREERQAGGEQQCSVPLLVLQREGAGKEGWPTARASVIEEGLAATEVAVAEGRKGGGGRGCDRGGLGCDEEGLGCGRSGWEEEVVSSNWWQQRLVTGASRYCRRLAATANKLRQWETEEEGWVATAEGMATLAVPCQGLAER
ncbi:hypothetical protein B296_00007232 [Ensete ventricosum]|uniref:Uncharacterized protein n=1 Tax=Ensete ventricosum TaxID=4639 RepID=A0A427AZB3_ENSVE|nr:hypothetical protein B296_00007232 [Ensete ventricosum]